MLARQCPWAGCSSRRLCGRKTGGNEGSQLCSMGQGTAVDGRVLWVFMVGMVDVQNCKLVAMARECAVCI